MVNFASYTSREPEIIDNAGLMLIKLLRAIGLNQVFLAGMDGYSAYSGSNYINKTLEHDFSKEAERRNHLIADEMKKLNQQIKLNFITPTRYRLD